MRIRPEIAKGGRSGDIFLPDALVPKLREFWAYKRVGDDQLFGMFARCRDLLRQEPVQAANRADLDRPRLFADPIEVTAREKLIDADHVRLLNNWASYRELVEHVARLSYANRNHLLFFRGQNKDYQSKAGGSTLYPAIYRGDNTPQAELGRS